MRRTLMLAILVLGGCDVTPAEIDPPVEPSGYFPPALFRPTVNCGPLSWSNPRPVLTEFEDAWYSKSLQAAGERPLSFARGSPETLRFTYLRSFDPPVIVRVERAATGAATLTATMLSGKEGETPGEPSNTMSRTLTQDEIERLLVLRQGAVRKPPVDCTMTFDGAEWIVEAAGADGYRFVKATSPQSGPVHDLGVALLGFTGWAVEPVY